MSDYLSFEGQVEPMPWGDAVFTILRLPEHIELALKKQGAKRVEGEIQEHPVNMAITKAPVVEGAFLWAGKSFLKDAGIEPGETLQVRLRKADPDIVELPDDVRRAFLSGGGFEAWEALTPGKRRNLLHTIATARKDETRIRRITKLVNDLSETEC